MFSRISVRAGGTISTVRRPLRTVSQFQRGQHQHVHSVRVKEARRPGFLVASLAAGYLCYAIYDRLVLTPLLKAQDELERNMDEETKKAIDKAIAEEDRNWFIPFPGTTKMIKQKPYRGSDPEWQEFMKFSKDKELAQKVRCDLAEKVRYHCSRDVFLSSRIGKPMKIRRFWLDLDFPHSPPPTYERSGIEITDEYVSWTTMPVNSLAVNVLRQTLWPSVFVQSSFAFLKVLFSQNVQRAGTVFGLETKPQPTYEALVALHKARSANGDSSGMSTVPTTRNPDASEKQPNMISANSSPSASPPPAKKLKSTDEVQIDKSSISVVSESIKPSFSSVQEHMSAARTAFKIKWVSTRRPPPCDPPRGSIRVSGLVEIEAAKAWLVIDVISNWDPKTKDFDLRTTKLSLRRVQHKVQVAKGGA